MNKSNSNSIHFDPLSTEQLRDPYTVYERLRDEDPIHYEPDFDLWVISRYQDVVEAAKNHDAFSSRDAVRSSIAEPAPEVAAVLEQGYPPAPTLTDSDEPLHSRLRGLVNKAFTHRRVSELEPRIETFGEGLVDSFVDTCEGDLIELFAWPFPMMSIGEMLGVPRDDLEQLHRWSYDWLRLIQATDPVERQVEYARSFVALQRYTMSKLEERRQNPGSEDLMSALLEARLEGGESLSMEEAMRVPLNLIIAGHVTVTRAIGNSLDLLLDQPALLERLRRDGGLLPAAVEELLRLESPAQGLFRTTTRDVEIGGVTIPEGARVMLHFGSANRDSSEFEQAEAVQLDRDGLMRHVAFGKGIHTCVGAPLARLELRIALDILLARLPGLRRHREDQPVRDTIFFARGFTRFPVEWNRSS